MVLVGNGTGDGAPAPDIGKPLVGRLSPKTSGIPKGSRSALSLSRQTLGFVAGLIRRHRRAIGSAWRKLDPHRQALLTLARLRKAETYANLGAGFGISTTTAWCYVAETVELLSARAPKLRAALRQAKTDGHAYLILWTAR
ncbi:transposase family protein [Nocardia terpenica]